MTWPINRLLSVKSRTRLASWNVRTLHETGKYTQVAREKERYNNEVRWNTYGTLILSHRQTLLNSGKENENDPDEAGVGIMLSKTSCRIHIEWEPVSDRITTARLDLHFHNNTVIQCYAPNNDASEEKTTFMTWYKQPST